MTINTNNALTASANAITIGGGIYSEDVLAIVRTINYSTYHCSPKTHFTLNCWKDSLYSGTGRATSNSVRLSGSAWTTLAETDIYVDRYSALHSASFGAECLLSSSNTLMLSLTCSGPYGTITPNGTWTTINNGGEGQFNFSWANCLVNGDYPTSSWVSVVLRGRMPTGGSVGEIGSIRLFDRKPPLTELSGPLFKPVVL